MHETQSRILDILARLKDLAPAGYAIAMNIRFTTPDFLFQSYGSDWIAHYSQNGYVMQDPTVHWGFENLGTIRWTDLVAKDSAGVLQQAAKFGLKYGFVVAVDGPELRSIGSFASSSGEFTDDEITRIQQKVNQLALLLSDAKTLTEETRSSLKKLSVNVTHP